MPSINIISFQAYHALHSPVSGDVQTASQGATACRLLWPEYRESLDPSACAEESVLPPSSHSCLGGRHGCETSRLPAWRAWRHICWGVRGEISQISANNPRSGEGGTAKDTQENEKKKSIGIGKKSTYKNVPPEKSNNMPVHHMPLSPSRRPPPPRILIRNHVEIAPTGAAKLNTTKCPRAARFDSPCLRRTDVKPNAAGAL